MLRWHTKPNAILLRYSSQRSSFVKVKEGPPFKPQIFEYVKINCGGRTYTLSKELLVSRKNALLERLAFEVLTVPSGCKVARNHYFFNRNPDVFHQVVHFYKTGNLHIPKGLCSSVVRTELQFWGISELRIGPCCFSNYKHKLTEKKQTEELMNSISNVDYENDAVMSYMNLNFYDNFIHKLRMCFSYTEKKEGITEDYAFFSVIFTLLAVALNGFISDMSNRISTTNDFRKYDFKGNLTLQEIHALTKPNSISLGIDIFLTILFITDQSLRFAASCNRRMFFTSFLNLNDLFCNLINLTGVLTFLIASDIPNLLEFLCYIARSLRILRLLRHCRSLTVIFYTTKLLFFDAYFIVYVFFIITIVSGTIMFFADYYLNFSDQAPKVSTFSKGYYWAVVTLTTVGFGRYVPTCPLSYAVATIIIGLSLLVTIMRYPVLTQTLCLYFEVSKLLVLESLSPKDRMFQRRKSFRM